MPSYLERELTFNEETALVAVVECLQRRIGYEFKDKDLLLTVCLPRLNGEREFNFNRLEEVGDKMYIAALTAKYYEIYPKYRGREIAEPMHEMVSNEQMKDDVVENGLDVYFHFFKDFPERRLSDQLEALVGALHMDGGFEVARKFVTDNFLHELVDVKDLKGIPRRTELKEYRKSLYRALKEKR